jgi:hypothetical protein
MPVSLIARRTVSSSLFQATHPIPHIAIFIPELLLFFTALQDICVFFGVSR